MANHPKCGYCGGVIVYKPYTETIAGTKYSFHAKQCAVAFRSMKCGYCGGAIVYEPYRETIGNNDMTFHAKSCAVAYKKELKKKA